MSKYHTVPLALGEYVVLETFAPTLDDLKEQTTAFGIIINSGKPDFSKTIPLTAKIVSKGSMVPDSDFSVGDIIVYPNGNCVGIEDPRILGEEDFPKKQRRQFCYTHYKNIGARIIEV